MGLLSYFGIGNDNSNNFNWQAFGSNGGTVDDSGNLYNRDGVKIGSIETGTNGAFNTDNVKLANNSNAGSSGMSTAAGLIGAGASVMSAITGMQNLGLAKKQFEYEKALGNANLYNSATTTNNSILNSAKVGNALAGDSMTDSQKSANLADAQSRYVKTTV